MTPVDPRVDPALVPPGSRAIVMAETQDCYADLPSIRTPDDRVISRWALTDEERLFVAAGADVYLEVSTFGQKLQPVRMSVGPCDWRKP